jgi:hypothetical protein
MIKAESVLDRPLALCGGSGAALANPAPAKPLTASTRAGHSIFLKFRFGFLVLKNFGFLDIRNQSVF